MISTIKSIIKAITTRLLILPLLPGQGVFSSEKSDEIDFTITMYKPDIERAIDKISVGRVADELLDEYVDYINYRFTLALEGVKHLEKRVKIEEIDNMHHRLFGKSDIVVGETVGTLIAGLKKFKPTKKKYEGNVRYIGILDKAKVYVNSHVERKEIYVIDRSMIDIKYHVLTGADRIDLNIKTKINNESVTKYSLIS